MVMGNMKKLRKLRLMPPAAAGSGASCPMSSTGFRASAVASVAAAGAGSKFGHFALTHVA